LSIFLTLLAAASAIAIAMSSAPVASSVALWVFAASAGGYGALVGAGGGFLLVPFLLIALDLPPEIAAGTSLSAVFAQATTSAVLALQDRRVDRVAAAWMAAVAVPGSIVGAVAADWLSGPLFSWTFAVLLVAGAAAVTWGPRTSDAGDQPVGRWHEHKALALGASLAIGVASSALGVGGGVFLVPLMIAGLAFPPLVAIATSQAILCASSLVGLATHARLGHVDLALASVLAPAMVTGAVAARRIAPHVPVTALRRLLAVALLLVGLRLAWRAS